METSAVSEILCGQVSEFIAARIGLHFPPERRADLQRGLAGAADELGFAGGAACAQWLLSSPLTKAQLQVLASHLTIGETYFFREKRTFEVLAESVLPDLIRSRQNGERRLRFWSAACCTGEEPYSLAIQLDQAIPDLPDWNVTILATDINERFLQKAAAGVYGEWSFRESPAWFKERYFHRTSDGRHAILPEIKKRVTFMNLNLAEDVYPSLATDTNAMDVIFCRNVLMYFTPPQARKVVRNLRCALVDDGWLAVSPSEGLQALSSRFVLVNFPGVILYQKSDAKVHAEQPWTLSSHREPAEFVAPAFEATLPWTPPTPVDLPPEEPASPESAPTPLDVATSFYQQGRYAEAADTLLASLTANAAPDPQAFSLLARALANQGRLAGALTWCERWVAADKLDPSGHYLRAVVLQELGDHEPARRSLQRALYLQPDFVLAHFALANLARSRDEIAGAEKHFTTALRLLRRCQPGDLLPESDGLTAGRLTEIISSIVAMETRP
ncbi:MAG: tetratricopeptide repeat protein [Verrucomicrobia bacterium]|nr:tetratricopeptide repeat protein [Verrucomicrobiota bacterium]